MYIITTPSSVYNPQPQTTTTTLKMETPVMKEDVLNELMDELSVDTENNESIAESLPSFINDVMDKKERKKLRELAKKSDPGYHSYYILRKNTKIKIECYSTGCNPGTRIRCPTTGMRFSDRVSSLQEQLYYKVRMPAIGTGDEPVTLYYDTPESYERHHFTALPQIAKEDWQNRNRNGKYQLPEETPDFIEVK